MRADLTWSLAVSRRANTLCGQSVPQHEEFIFRRKLTLKLAHISRALQATHALTLYTDHSLGAPETKLTGTHIATG
jgi:hypothetical protein